MFFKLSINTTMRNQTFRTKLPKIVGLAYALSGGISATRVDAASLPNQEEMWRIIQAQQKEIEALKAKLQQVEIQPLARLHRKPRRNSSRYKSWNARQPIIVTSKQK
jgi:hypothetical protein